MQESYTDLIRQLDDVNMQLRFIEEDIQEAGYVTRDQLKERSELTKRSVEIAAKFPDVVSNKG